MTRFYITVLVKVLATLLSTQLSVNVPGRVAGDALSAWVPAPSLRNSDCVPGSYLQPSLA